MNGLRLGRKACVAAAWLMLAACASTSSAPISTEQEPSWQRTETGVLVMPAHGSAQQVRLEVMEANAIRVVAVPADGPTLRPSLIVVDQPGGAFEVAENDGLVTLSTSQMRASVSLQDGRVSFTDENGRPLLSEEARGQFTPKDVQGQPYFSIAQTFNPNSDEGFYGLGQHQNGQLNYNGEDVELAQHNIVDAVPFVVSTRNYGVLWDNNGISRFGDTRAYQPLNASLRLFDANGAAGGLTGTYYRGEQALVTRVDADPNFQFLPADQFLRTPPGRGAWPAAFGETSPTRITWEGSIESDAAGTHKFQLYGSNYFKLWVDGQLVLDRWRQNWNPWSHNFEIAMQPGERHRLRVEWIPNDGYFRLLHLDPLPQAERHALTLSSEVARAVDYYVVAGDDMDDVIAGYRKLTGPAVMLPRWAYGFWQSRQRYTNQRELTDVVREYRRRDIPLDNIVLDWFYWPENAWGSHEFDPARFPDPAGMVRDIHGMNAQIMISVWPKFYPTTDNYRELDAAGHIYRRQIEMQSKDWVGPGYLNAFYDPYSPEARTMFWRQVQENIGVHGFDAWWADATEPDSHSNLDYAERALRMGPTAMGPGEEFFNSYVLMSSRAFYDGQRSSRPNQRVFILTRSAWAGLQRYGSAHWSGDVAGRWDDFREQIPAGLNMSLSGLPNWTHDIGGFANEDRYTRQEPAHQPEYRELYTRWFQFGAFSPLFRSHGEFPYRETYNMAPRGSEVYNTLVYYTQLRYRLLPYVYTLAGDTYHRNGTIMRALVMDFPNDPRVRNIADQYMFGPSFLVNPVTEFRARSRQVYLPAGTRWYDFYTGQAYDGGRELTATAPLSRMPLYVRAGAIVPTGPAVEYTSQNLGGPITLMVYTGANGSFDIYEDDGTTDGYASGAFARVPVSYDDATGAVTIGARQGSYPGMTAQRTINVRWISGPNRNASNLDARADATVRYSGAAVSVQRPRR